MSISSKRLQKRNTAVGRGLTVSIGAAAVTLSTSYAFGDVFGTRHSLHRSWREAKVFYGDLTGMVVLAAGIVIIPGAPLGVITTKVEALAGVLFSQRNC